MQGNASDDMLGMKICSWAYASELNVLYFMSNEKERIIKELNDKETTDDSGRETDLFFPGKSII